MINVYNDPTLLDFLVVCNQLPQDERDQLSAFTGEPYNVDGAAVGNFTIPGHKWVIKADDEPIIVGGFAPVRPGVWRDFMLTTPQAWEKHWFPVTRICRRIMNAMFLSGAAHRIECVVPTQRVSRCLEKWYAVVGYNYEGLSYGYCANGADAMVFARVKH